MVRIRLTRAGAKKRPFYRVVVTDSRRPREGQFLDILGIYNPMEEPALVRIDQEKAALWLSRGAQLSDTVKSLFAKVGIRKISSSPAREQEMAEGGLRNAE
ncbi:MAG: 30S ribosomal protein S16 [Candidatus Tectomicrobia bacterium]|uniref:Small ribosomal subunit protein bS16 n=1 Tax=Tectimicrobiota bacterium TaxID=2528274 RepID=A0A932FYW6_UNCTE|nr:30S ribosomal protein S16 [Candidatus Tectomicrobia bacterium]